MSDDTLRVVLLPDVHTPYHHEVAWGCALDVVERWRPGVVIQVGDFSSFDSVSSHPHDPKHVLSLEQEIRGSNLALDELDLACRRGGVPRGNKWMLEGNHETRLDRYLLDRAPEARFAVDWRRKLKLDRRGWRTLPYKSSLQFGKLRITHDVGRSGANAARQSLLDTGDNIAFGHTHRVQVVYQGQLSGERHVAATLGWLGDHDKIDYRHRDLVKRDWQHAIGVAYFLASGEFWLHVVPIVRGRCVIDGRVFSAKKRSRS